MKFPLNTYVLAFAAAALTAGITLPLWRRWCFWAGLVDDPGHRKIHHQPVPLAGGLAITTGLVVPLLLGWSWLALHPGGAVPPETTSGMLDRSWAFPLKYGFGKRALELAGILVGAVGMLVVGCLDDKWELRPLPKFGGQFLIAIAVAACGVRLTLFVPSPLFSYAATVLWILTIVNAFNFMDNMNGLCAGLGTIAALFFGVFAAVQGQYLVALLAFASAGALLGFLPWNFPHAKAFLGDGGSHLVGFLLAVLAILPHFYTPEHPREAAVLTPLLVLAVPLLDLVWVVVLRWRIGQPFYQGDTNHLSHRLVRRGYSPAQAVMLIWGAALLPPLLLLLL